MIKFVKTDGNKLFWHLFVLQCAKFLWASYNKPLDLLGTMKTLSKYGELKFLGFGIHIRYYDHIPRGIPSENIHMLDLDLKIEKIKI